MSDSLERIPARRIWQVGALCHAIADALEARFGSVTVQGELAGVSRAASGHWYFSLKDAAGQLRCAMFRRAASLLDWQPQEGQQVEVRGRLAVYEARGELQLIVESMRRAGQGALYEDFLRRKAALQALGWFDAARKRVATPYPRGIGLVTSLGAAALRDVASTWARRAPHVPVVLVPALVQGQGAPADLVRALQTLYRLVERQRQGTAPADIAPIDTIVLVRGGGSLEDLWAFNDEGVAEAIIHSPVPLITGVGHETDFTIADFCADLRAPTPTAAAELAALPREDILHQVTLEGQRLGQWVERRLQNEAQRLDRLGWTLERACGRFRTQSQRLQQIEGRMQHVLPRWLGVHRPRWEAWRQRLEQAVRQQRITREQRMQLSLWQTRMQRVLHLQHAMAVSHLRELERRLHDSVHTALEAQVASLTTLETGLRLMNPQALLQRGYALLQDDQGHLLSHRRDFRLQQQVHARISDGEVLLTPLPVQIPLQGEEGE